MKPELPTLADVISHYDLRAKKSLGQNFILDLNVTRKIVRAAGVLDGAQVIEIGPGPGGLTRALLESDAAHVTIIEKDSRAVRALEVLREHYPDRLTITDGDALGFDLETVARPKHIVANLPYNIATELLFGWLEMIYQDGARRGVEMSADISRVDSPIIFSTEKIQGMTSKGNVIDSMVLMFQKEVAERMVAKPRSKAYGRISVMAQWLCEVGICFDLPPEVFSPPPKVTSSVVRLVPRGTPLVDVDKDVLERVVKAAFANRRKMLRTNLKGLHADVESWLEAAGVKPTQRAEELTVEQFCGLAKTL